MTFTSLDSMGKTSLMLDLISQRQRALGSNIANVDTPGYVALYADFDASELDLASDIMQKYDVKTFDPSYAGSLYLGIETYITEQEYWDMLFQLSGDANADDWDNWDDWDWDSWDDWDDDLDNMDWDDWSDIDEPQTVVAEEEPVISEQPIADEPTVEPVIEEEPATTEEPQE